MKFITVLMLLCFFFFLVFADECGNLIRALLLHGFESKARDLQLQLNALITYVMSCKSDIWSGGESLEMNGTV